MSSKPKLDFSTMNQSEHEQTLRKLLWVGYENLNEAGVAELCWAADGVLRDLDKLRVRDKVLHAIEAEIVSLFGPTIGDEAEQLREEGQKLAGGGIFGSAGIPESQAEDELYDEEDDG